MGRFEGGRRDRGQGEKLKGKAVKGEGRMRMTMEKAGRSWNGKSNEEEGNKSEKTGCSSPWLWSWAGGSFELEKGANPVQG